MAWNKHLVSIKLMLKVVIDADDAEPDHSSCCGQQNECHHVPSLSPTPSLFSPSDYHKVDTTERAGTEDVNVV